MCNIKTALGSFKIHLLIGILLVLNYSNVNAQYYIGTNPTDEEQSLNDKYETTMDNVNTSLDTVDDFTTNLELFVEYAQQLEQLATIAAMLTQDQNTSSSFDALADFATQLQHVAVAAEAIDGLADHAQTVEEEASILPLEELFALANIDLPDISGIIDAFDIIDDLDVNVGDIEGIPDDKAQEIVKGVMGALTPANYSIDYLSQDNYSDMAGLSKKKAIKAIITTIYIHKMESVIVDEADSISEMSNDFRLIKNDLQNFVNISSMGYIEFKYPLIPSIGYASNNTFGNFITRERFRSKLHTELEFMETYVDEDNPISEGERIYLILDTVEKVIKTTLENEGL